MINKFQRGGPGVFKCRLCSRGSRETGVQALGSQLCPECYELAGLENMMIDDGFLSDPCKPEVRSLFKAAIAKGGNEGKLRENFKDLLAAAGEEA